MGTGKKEATRRERQNQNNDGMPNVRVKGENFYRSPKKLRLLNRFKEGRPQRNADGQITKAATYQSKEIPKARIEPNRKWFTNSRVISQQTLTAFRDAVGQQAADPNAYLLKSNKLPMSLIRDEKSDIQTKNGIRQHKAKMVIETSSFKDTFGPKALRKKVKLSIASFNSLAKESEKMHGTYLDRVEELKLLSGQGQPASNGEDATADRNHVSEMPQEITGTLLAPKESIFNKGQSKRIWNELYKVMDSSDVIAHVLDARDPLGTRCRAVEKYLREEAAHKHLVFILNKCDLVPTAVAATWVRTLSKEYPTLAFHASITNSFGKGSLIALLRQFAVLHSDRKQVSVGFIGYPNTGKSSIINTLRKKMVCKTAPIPGETKVWQYITLTRRIYLIDCPGVVPPNANDSDTELLLRGVVRVENVENPSQYVAAMLNRCQSRHIERTYGLKNWKNEDDFLDQLARKGGRLLKGGEADANAVAKMVLNDFIRGKVPWFVAPPKLPENEAGDATAPSLEGRSGALGEQKVGTKRKWLEMETAQKEVAEEKDEESGDSDSNDDDNDDDNNDDDDNDEDNNNGEEAKEKKTDSPSEAKIKDDDSVAASEDSFLGLSDAEENDDGAS